MKGILLLAAIHILIIHQSRKPHLAQSMGMEQQFALTMPMQKSEKTELIAYTHAPIKLYWGIMMY